MNVLNALAQANAQLAATLTDTVLCAHRTDVSDGAGGTTVTYGTESSVAARVHADTTTSGNAAGTEQDVDTFTIVSTTPDGIRTGDRVRWVDPTGSTRTLYVVDVTGSSWQIGAYSTAVEAP